MRRGGKTRKGCNHCGLRAILFICQLIEGLTHASSLSKTVETASINEQKKKFHNNLTVLCGFP
jgi:hypothetical protein